MSISIYTPWVRSTIKWVGALLIPSVLIGFYYYAKTAADREYKETTKTIGKDKTATQTQVDNYELKEVDDNNQIKWDLSANSGTTSNNTNYDLKGVHMKYYDGPNVKMSIAAPLGKVDSTTKFVTLNSQKGARVKGEGDGGKSVFESETVELDKNNKFFATGGVIIEWADSAKVTGNEARGKLDKNGLQDVKVYGHTHALIAVKDDPPDPSQPQTQAKSGM